MQYIKQAEAFADYCKDNRKMISEKARLLWYALFHVLNRKYWPIGLETINKHELQALFPYSDETVRRASKELCDLGLIEFEPETRKADARYALIQLYKDEIVRDDEEDIEIAEKDDKSSTCAGPAPNLRQTCGKPAENLRQTCGKPAPNLRQTCAESAASEKGENKVLSIYRARACTHEDKDENKDKYVDPNKAASEKEEVEVPVSGMSRGYPDATREDTGKEDVSEAIAHARECGFNISKISRKHIANIVGRYGFVWVCAALERAALRGKDKTNLGYVMAILSKWQANGCIDGAEPDAIRQKRELDAELRRLGLTEEEYYSLP